MKDSGYSRMPWGCFSLERTGKLSKFGGKMETLKLQENQGPATVEWFNSKQMCQNGPVKVHTWIRCLDLKFDVDSKLTKLELFCSLSMCKAGRRIPQKICSCSCSSAAAEGGSVKELRMTQYNCMRKVSWFFFFLIDGKPFVISLKFTTQYLMLLNYKNPKGIEFLGCDIIKCDRIQEILIYFK